MANYLLGLLKQPSTYAGLGLFLGTAGIHFSNPDVMPGIVQACTAVAGLASILLNEGGAQK